MEFADVLRHRRMVRSYTDEPVEREAIERTVAAGLKAPSGGFSQGARFVVVTEPEGRRAVARAGWGGLVHRARHRPNAAATDMAGAAHNRPKVAVLKREGREATGETGSFPRALGRGPTGKPFPPC